MNYTREQLLEMLNASEGKEGYRERVEAIRAELAKLDAKESDEETSD